MLNKDIKNLVYRYLLCHRFNRMITEIDDTVPTCMYTSFHIIPHYRTELPGYQLMMYKDIDQKGWQYNRVSKFSSHDVLYVDDCFMLWGPLTRAHECFHECFAMSFVNGQVYYAVNTNGNIKLQNSEIMTRKEVHARFIALGFFPYKYID